MTRLLGVTQRMSIAPGSGEKRDCLAQDWAPFLSSAGARWIALPNHAPTAAALVRELDVAGLLLTGGDDIGVFPERDFTERSLIEDFLRRGLPILGVCRGLQVLHWHFGGGLRPLSGDLHVGKRHTVDFVNGEARVVNSYHNNALDHTGLSGEYPLRPIALCRDDGTVEAAGAERVLGIMWHPEREAEPAAGDIEMFQRHFNL